MAQHIYCIDAGSSFCPCNLIFTNNCIVCSMLNEKNKCDCNWQGVCVYQDYLWSGMQKEYVTKVKCKLKEKYIWPDKLVMFKIKIDSMTLLKKYDQPGSYAYIRPTNYSDEYAVRSYAMNIDYENLIITFPVNLTSPRTRILAQAEEELIITGPFWNETFELNHIKSSHNRRWLIIGRSIGQASIPPVVKNLLRGENTILAFLDPGGLKMNLAESELKKLGISVNSLDLNSAGHKNMIKDIVEKQNIDFIYSGGSEIQHKTIENLLSKSIKKIPLVKSNDSKVWSIEGIYDTCNAKMDSSKKDFEKPVKRKVYY